MLKDDAMIKGRKARTEPKRREIRLAARQADDTQPPDSALPSLINSPKGNATGALGVRQRGRKAHGI